MRLYTHRANGRAFEACQWFENGDHPLDKAGEYLNEDTGLTDLTEGKIVRGFARPDVSGETMCSVCGARLAVHGWIDSVRSVSVLSQGVVVCPGNYVFNEAGTDIYDSCRPDAFDAAFDAVVDPTSTSTRDVVEAKAESADIVAMDHAACLMETEAEVIRGRVFKYGADTPMTLVNYRDELVASAAAIRGLAARKTAAHRERES